MMVATMFSLARLKTCHDAIVTVRRSDSILSNARPSRNIDHFPVLAVFLHAFPAFCFLIADAENAPLIEVCGSDLGGQVLTLHRVNSEEKIALEDPTRRGTFLSAVPLDPSTDAGHFEAGRPHIGDWEQFSLEEVSVESLSSPIVVERIKAIARFFIEKPTASWIIRHLADVDGCGLAAGLDSILPLIRLDEINVLAEILMEQPELVECLAMGAPDDLWAARGIPRLLRWIERRDDPSIVRAVDESPEDEAILARTGTHRKPCCFLYVLSHAMRRKVVPRKRLCALTTVRNEGIYFLEWLAHHRACGVEHFFVYTNDNEDGSDQLLSALHEAGLITLIVNRAVSGINVQCKAYGHALSIDPLILDYEWCAILDCDEFIIPNSQLYSSVVDFIEFIERQRTDVICLNWKFVGAAPIEGGIDAAFRPLTERNTRIVGNGAIGEGWRLIKSIVRPRFMSGSGAHFPTNPSLEPFVARLADGSLHEALSPPQGFPRDAMFADSGQYGTTYILHFYFKSAVEWVWKSSRSRGTDPLAGFDSTRFDDNWANPYVLQAEDAHQERVQENSPFSEAARAERDRLRAIPGIWEAEIYVRKTFTERIKWIVQEIVHLDVPSQVREDWRFIFLQMEQECY